jgi:hypothetical protein
MSGKIQINVSGGNASFGNVTQGDHNVVTSTTNNASQVIEDHCAQARAGIERLADASGRPAAERAAALEQLESLKTKAVAADAKPAEGAGILKTVRDNVGWAYPIIKDFAKVAWPAALLLLGM